MFLFLKQIADLDRYLEDFQLLSLQTSEPLWQVNLGPGDQPQGGQPQQDHSPEDVLDPEDLSDPEEDVPGPLLRNVLEEDEEEEEDDWSPVLPRRDGIQKFL